MNQKISFKLTNNCPANWDTMLPDENGRFCGECQKTVIDFSIMSDAEVADFLKTPANWQFSCGQFTDEQLTEGVFVPSLPVIADKTTAFRRAAILIVGLTAAGTPLTLYAQTKQPDSVPYGYEIVTEQVLVKPAEIREIPVPAEYTTITYKKLIRKGGFIEWREINLKPDAPETYSDINVTALQRKLKEKGFYKGKIDNVLGAKTQEAIKNYRIKMNLGSDATIDYNTLKALDLVN